MKKLFVILLAGIIALSLVSCLPSGENKTEFLLPAVVNRGSIPSLLTALDEFIAPTLVSSELKNGDCILAYFVVDHDNQPQGSSHFQVSELSYGIMGKNVAEIRDDFDKTDIFNDTDFFIDDFLPIQALTPQLYHPRLGGNFFLIFEHSVPEGQSIEYFAIVDESVDESINVYLIAKKANEKDDQNISRRIIHAIDMRDIINELGTDTTIEGVPVKELKFDIQYCTGVNNEDGNYIPAYKEHKDIKLSILK